MNKSIVITVLLMLASLAVGLLVGRGERLALTAIPSAAPSSPVEPPQTGEVRLTPAQIENAGIVVEPVPARDAREVVEVGGVIEIDPSRSTRISARAAGRVVRLAGTVGQRVEAGQTVATVDCPEVADRRVRVRAAAARLGVARRRLERERVLAGDSTQVTTAIAEARLRRDRAVADARRASRTWERAREMYPEVVSKADHDAARAEAERTRVELRTAEQVLSAEERANRVGVRVRTETENALTEVECALAELEAARDALSSLGVGDGPRGEITITAPLSGVIATRPVNVDEWVEASAPLYTIVDLSRVWAQIDIYEQHLRRLKVGDSVTVTSGAWPGRTFEGRLSFIHPSLEEHAKTARGRVELMNGGDLLRNGMFVKGQITVGRSVGVPTIPRDAVLQDGEEAYVYVEAARGRFVRRPVVLGTPEREAYEVKRGLRPGDRIVTRGAFFVKSEQQREQIGEDE